MKKLVFIIFLSILCSVFGFANQSHARTNITDWYIKDFKSEILVNKDSSLDITEWITADCGNLPDKHGIYRILSSRYFVEANKSIATPTQVISVTDFNNSPIKYQKINDSKNYTLTLKIGDSNITVTGVNYYKINYQVTNAIRFTNSKFDEFYWNLNGNFWQIETDNFTSSITFPKEVDLTKSEINLYSGKMNASDNKLAIYEVVNSNTLKVLSTAALWAEEGITISSTFSKGIFIEPKLSLIEKNNITLILILNILLPILVLVMSIFIWKVFGKDPKIKKVIVPEFSIPGKLSPMEMGELIKDGNLEAKHITAEIINLAVQGVIKIEKIEKKNIFSQEDYKLIRSNTSNVELTPRQKSLYSFLFKQDYTKKPVTNLKDLFINNDQEDKKANNSEIKLSSLKNKFYKHITDLQGQIEMYLSKNKLIVKNSRMPGIYMGSIGVMAIFFGFVNFQYWGIFVSGIIMLIIAPFMKRRTIEGAEMINKIKGFELYMKTAEKYRQRFNERENIFERFLPYAILFGITGLWIKKIKDIYGEEYFNSYLPIWYYGATISSFNLNSFDSMISGLSANMSSAIASSPSSSGAGGGGFSGGGGGGGGGGGW